MKYAHYDDQGLITFYAPELLPGDGVPEPFIAVSDADWWRHILGDVFWRVDVGGDELKLVESAPDAEPTYPTKQDAISAMTSRINGFTAQIDLGVPDAELRAREKKAEAARAYLSGIAIPEQVQTLQLETELTGGTVDELTVTIKVRADRDDKMNAKISGLRRKVKADLLAETDPFKFEVILNDGKAKTMAMADDLGIKVP